MLRYLDAEQAAEADQYSWSEGYGKKTLFERAQARVWVGGRRVGVPSGFKVDVKAPRGKRRRFPVEVDAASSEDLRDFLETLQGERRRRREVTLEHVVDGTLALYRVRGENASGFACEMVSGEPVVFSRGRRVTFD